MGMSRTHLNARHIAKADAALAMATAVANRQKIDEANNTAKSETDDWLLVQHNLWKNAVNNTRSALFLATGLYDEVMSAEVTLRISGGSMTLPHSCKLY